MSKLDSGKAFAVQDGRGRWYRVIDGTWQKHLTLPCLFFHANTANATAEVFTTKKNRCRMVPVYFGPHHRRQDP